MLCIVRSFFSFFVLSVVMISTHYSDPPQQKFTLRIYRHLGYNQLPNLTYTFCFANSFNSVHKVFFSSTRSCRWLNTLLLVPCFTWISLKSSLNRRLSLSDISFCRSRRSCRYPCWLWNKNKSWLLHCVKLLIHHEEIFDIIMLSTFHSINIIFTPTPVTI